MGKGGPSSGSGRGKSQILWWPWAFAAVALAVIAGSWFQTSAASKKKKGGKKGGGAQAGAAGGGTENLETLKLIGTLSEQVSALHGAGELTQETASEYLEMLLLLEKGIVGDDSTARGIRDMIQVVRAQLIAAGAGLNDTEVEAKYNVSSYSSGKFWEGHYQNQGEAVQFDWYVGWREPLKPQGETLKDFVGEVVPPGPEKEVLIMGCGNSAMSADMYSDGYRRIRNIDISPTVIEQMRKRHAEDLPGVTWEVKDASKLDNVKDGAFDGVVDKGTLDATSTNEELSRAIIAEARRVLRPGGALVTVGSKPVPLLKDEPFPGFECRPAQQLIRLKTKHEETHSFAQRCKAV